MKVAVLGSAFDPPTVGHLDVVKQCLEKFDAVWLVPSFNHAFNKNMRPYVHRVEMTEAFARDIALDNVKVQACEDRIKPTSANQPIYSLDLLAFLQNLFPAHSYSLVIGPDNEKQFDKFYLAEKLKTDFSPYIAHERVNMRSTLVRQALHKGKSISAMVTPGVANYIKIQDVYPHKTTDL